jgi:Bacterial Ig-like domain
MPAIGFISGFGVGVTGQYSTIHSNAVATDAAGDTFITGSFRGTVAFNPSSSSSNFTSNGTQDTFVAKYGPSGALIWAKTFAGQATTVSGGGTTYAVSQGSAIAVDGLGNVFVAGGFSGKVNLSGASGVTTIAGPSSTTEVFVTKLDSSGNLDWVDAVTGTTYDNDQAYALALDGFGGVVIAGSFQDSATFGSVTLKAGGVFEAFAARVNGIGAFIWAVATQGTPGSNAEIHGLAVDGSGNVDLAGFFSSTVDFDPSSSTTSLISLGSDDAVLWKLNINGQFLWARDYGSADYDAATAVAVDASGNFYATGAFSDTVNFGTALHPDSLTAGPIFDAFVLKTDPNGNEVWVKGLVGPGGWSKGQGIAVESTGQIDLAGTFNGLVDFDPNAGTDNLTSVGNTDVFVAGLSPAGALNYAFQAGRTNFNAALGIAVNASETASITGAYAGSISFGSISVASAGIASVFVAQLTTELSAPSAPSNPVLEASSDTGLSQTDGITSDTAPVFDVNVAGISNVVELLRNGVVVGQRTGPGAIADPGPIPDGAYLYSALQISPAGVVGPPSSVTSITILTKPPLAPSSLTLAPTDDTGVVGDDVTSVRQPQLSVVVPANVLVQLVDAGSVVGSIFTATGGTVLVMPSLPLADGTYVLQARMMDVAGNLGPLGPALSLTILAVPPPAPSTPSLLPIDVTGPVGGTLTSVRQPRIVGLAKAGTTVEVFNVVTRTILATASASANGSYTAMISSPLSDGLETVDVVAIDVAGNVSQTSPTLTFTIDATPPLAPSILTLLAADDSGTLGDDVTNVRQPRLTGKAEAGSTVQVLDSSGRLDGSAVAASNGTFTVKLNPALVDGMYTLQAKAIDLAGNVGPLGPSVILTILATPPAAPGAVSILPADDSGGPGLTNVRQPRLTGTAPANDLVQILGPTGQVYASATASSNGSYVAKLTSPLADGTYAFDAVATDTAGNVSSSGPILTFKIDSTPPASPTILTLLAADDSGMLGDDVTNVRQPRLTGKAEAGSTVHVLDGSGRLDGSVVVASNGTFTVKLSTVLVDGTYSLQAKAIDLAGNVGPFGPSVILTILATPPSAPGAISILLADDSAGPGLTNVRQPRLTGLAPANDLVQILGPTGQVYASATAGSNGSYVAELTSPLADGTYALDAVAIDVAGNVSQPSPTLTFTIDATPPLAPSILTLLAADDSGTLGDDVTNVRQPRLTGKAEAGSTVQVLDSSGRLDGSAVAASDGTFTVKLSTALLDGTYSLQAKAIDLAGNVGPLGPAVLLTILATPPAAPGAISILPADDSGGPGLTNLRQPRLTGIAPANDLVQILGPTDQVYASTTAGSNGSYVAKLTSPLADGTYAFDAVATDTAGNVSLPGPALTLTIDATPPSSPSAPTLLALDDSGTVGDHITNVRQPRLTATAGAGLTVRLLNAANVILGTATASATGSVTILPSSPLVDGTYSLQLVAVDMAGNVSAPGGPLSLTILATPPRTPAQPSLLAADDTGVLNDGMTSVLRPRLVGTAAPGGRIDWIEANGSVLVSTTASASTGSYQLQPPTALINGTLSVRVRETDVAGNVSLTSSAFSLTIRVASGDYFGDGRTDLGVFQLSPTTFLFQRSPGTGLYTFPWGSPGDVPVNGDFFGDGRDDVALYRPSTSTFYAYNVATAQFLTAQIGQPGDVPVPADYNGDGTTDFAVFRPSTGTWIVMDSATNSIYTHSLVSAGDVPVPADYYGNGHDDLAVYHPSTSTYSVYDPITGASAQATIGLPGSIPMPGDYEGLGHADFAVFQPSNFTWVIYLSASNTFYSRNWAIPGDYPVAGDYFGDGRNDLAVYRPSTSTFYEYDIASGAVQVNQIGTPGLDKPLVAPITDWFSFGGVNSPNLAMSPRSDSAAYGLSLVEAIPPDPADSTTAALVAGPKVLKATAVDWAIDSLSLEGWRTRR